MNEITLTLSKEILTQLLSGQVVKIETRDEIWTITPEPGNYKEFIKVVSDAMTNRYCFQHDKESMSEMSETKAAG